MRQRETCHQQRWLRAHRDGAQGKCDAGRTRRCESSELPDTECGDDAHRGQPGQEVVVVATAERRQDELQGERHKRDQDQRRLPASRRYGIEPGRKGDQHQTRWQREPKTTDQVADPRFDRHERGVGAVIDERLVDHVSEDAARERPCSDEKERYEGADRDRRERGQRSTALQDKRDKPDRDPDPNERRLEKHRRTAQHTDRQRTR